MKNGIVIPCYNEENRLDLAAFQRFVNQRFEYTLCFVNDGSKDGTLEMLQNFAKGQEHRVLVYDMPQNGGKAEAVRQGINHMLAETNVSNVGFIDADLATGFNDYRNLVLELINPLNRKEMVFGSRKMDDATDIDRSYLRDLASQSIGKVINKIIGLPIKDTQCGAKVFTRSTASLLFKSEFISRWLFDVELFIRIKNHFGGQGVMAAIKEVALKQWEEVEGSKITLKDSLKFPLQLFKIAMNYNVTPKIAGLRMNLRTSTLSMARSLFF